MSRAWIDISRPIVPGMPVWPGDPRVQVERVLSIAGGAKVNLSAISMCLHTGTHVDAPLHFLADGIGIGEMPLDALMGPARVIGVRGPKGIGAGQVRTWRVRLGERLLFKTGGRAPALLPEAAAVLVERGVRAVGIDGLSIGPPGEEGEQTHRVLLRGGVWILEGLELSRVKPGRYELVCLPLRIPGADGAPARAILRSLE